MNLPAESIFIRHLKPDETIAIVRELRALGLEQGKDFEFRYNKPGYINDDYTQGVEPGGAEFYFREGKWATYCSLKYAT